MKEEELRELELEVRELYKKKADSALLKDQNNALKRRLLQIEKRKAGYVEPEEVTLPEELMERIKRKSNEEVRKSKYSHQRKPSSS